MSEPLSVALARLTERLESGFANVDRRFDDQSATLSRIDAQVQKTNGRVTALETKNAVAEGIAKIDPSTAVLTAASVKWYFGLFVLGGSATLIALKYLGLLTLPLSVAR